MDFKPRLLTVEPGRELRWLGRLIMPGLFDGEHLFIIETAGEERVRFIQREFFRGLLVPLLFRSIEEGARAGFEAMNRALKERAKTAVKAVGWKSLARRRLTGYI